MTVEVDAASAKIVVVPVQCSMDDIVTVKVAASVDIVAVTVVGASVDIVSVGTVTVHTVVVRFDIVYDVIAGPVAIDTLAAEAVEEVATHAGHVFENYRNVEVSFGCCSGRTSLEQKSSLRHYFDHMLHSDQCYTSFSTCAGYPLRLLVKIHTMPVNCRFYVSLYLSMSLCWSNPERIGMV